MPAVNAFKNRKYPQKYPLSSQPKKYYKAPVTAYGDIISLPSTVVKGQVSVTVNGNTETDEEGNTKSTSAKGWRLGRKRTCLMSNQKPKRMAN